MLIACLGLVFVVISLYKLSMTVPQISRILSPLGVSAPLTNGEQVVHQVSFCSSFSHSLLVQLS